MSIGEALTRSQSQQFNKKLNKFGKMLGNKFLGIKKSFESEVTGGLAKLPALKPASLELSPSTKYFLAQEESLAQFALSKKENAELSSLSPNETAVEQTPVPEQNELLIDIEDSASSAAAISPKQSSPNQVNVELQPISSLSMLFNNLQSSLIPVATSAVSNKNYVPTLSQKQYTNRVEKLNDINSKVIKDSKSKFLFI